MKQPIWSESYKIASYLVNLRGKAGLYSILNLIQDVGWMHAFQLEVKLEKNQAWIFTRQKLLMERWPTWNQDVEIRTWLRPPMDRFLLRDYELFIAGKKVGECTSTFTVMDMQSRKIALVDWGQYPEIWNENASLKHNPEKIPLSENAQDLVQFEVRNSDIDMNQHVNNTKYAQWILDSLPLEILKAGVDLHEYEVNFLAEAKSGDVILVQQALIAQNPSEDMVTQFQGVRISDKKAVFTARLRSSVSP
jgi:medium-chain acyl-[acyl-carrier-protein] hydrolase